ncbi:MAG: hypothetical protein KY475_06245 [Planctomycetes bacterium]|nr:hypothetical protein [Planctomycetota bacterium]
MSEHCSGCGQSSCCCPSAGALGAGTGRGGNFVAGAEFLLVRPNFSDTAAFVRGVQAPDLSTIATHPETIDFEYEPAFRVYGGYRLDNGWGEVRVTYARLTGEREEDGVITAPNQFFVDPFEAIVGQVTVIDPSNRLFMQTLPGAFAPPGVPVPVADRIDTIAEVEVNVWDLELRRSVPLDSSAWGVEWSAGVRLAEVDQFYSSLVTAGGAQVAFGDYNVDFFGAGPRTGFSLERRGSFWAVFASGHGSLPLGTYDVEFTASRFGITAAQTQSVVRIIPITEAEVGARVSPLANVNLSAGWLFQSWFDLGTSGGRYAGFFSEQDDSNIMSFDGLFLRGEATF